MQLVTNPWASSTEAVIEKLKSSEKGLSEKEVYTEDLPPYRIKNP